MPGWFAGTPATTELGRKLRAVAVSPGVRHEVAFALDVSGVGRVRHLHNDGDRDYGDVGDHEIAMTVDGAASGFVAELKTGAVAVESIRRNPQVLTGALAAWWFWGRLPEALLVQAGTTMEPERRQMSALELMSHHRRLQRLVTHVQEQRTVHAAGGELDLVLGDHCRYCPALYGCPAVAEVIDGEPGPVYRSAVATIARSELRRSMVTEMVAQGPVDLGDGQTLVQRTQMRRVFDADRVTAVLASEFGADIAEQLGRRVYRAGDLDAWAAERADLGDSKRARQDNLMQLLADEGAMTYEPRHVQRTTYTGDVAGDHREEG